MENEAQYLELKIPINENTAKKIVALAALTGTKLTQIKETIAAELIDEEQFDSFVSLKLRSALSVMDGVTEEEEEQPRKSLFAKAEEEAQNVVDEIAGHSLSQDEDKGELTYSEQVEQAKQSRKPIPVPKDEELKLSEIEAPDVGENADAFLDAALQAPPKTQKSQRPKQSDASASFNPRRPKVKISDYTGSEAAETVPDGDLF